MVTLAKTAGAFFESTPDFTDATPKFDLATFDFVPTPEVAPIRLWSTGTARTFGFDPAFILAAGFGETNDFAVADFVTPDFAAADFAAATLVDLVDVLDWFATLERFFPPPRAADLLKPAVAFGTTALALIDTAFVGFRLLLALDLTDAFFFDKDNSFLTSSSFFIPDAPRIPLAVAI